MKEKFEERRQWTMESVRKVCVDNDLYTCGGNEEYGRMLDRVKEVYPNTEGIHAIAEDIMEHSEGQTITSIMFLLANKAVTILYV